MSQVLTPEELAALFEGLREVEGGPDGALSDSPQEIVSLGPGFPEPTEFKDSKVYQTGGWPRPRCGDPPY